MDVNNDKDTETTGMAEETRRKDPVRRTVYADEPTWMAIKLMARHLDRSENWVVRKAMMEFIKSEEAKAKGGQAT